MILFVQLQARPNVYHLDGKCNKEVIPTCDGIETLQKKAKQEWSCKLCQITTTSENDLNDHIQGKKHRTKASRRIQKIG